MFYFASLLDNLNVALMDSYTEEWTLSGIVALIHNPVPKGHHLLCSSIVIFYSLY